MTKRELVANCGQLRSHLLARSYVGEEEVASIWPKRSASKDAWWECRCQLMRFMGRAEWFNTQSAEAEEELLKSLREEPEWLTLLDGTRVGVYPKSFAALMWFRSHDWVLQWIHLRVEAIRAALEKGTLERGDYDPTDLIERGELEVSRQLAMMAYAACMEGNSVDYDEAKRTPEQFKNCAPIDLWRIHEAFTRVNSKNLALVHAISERKGGGGGNGSMSWNVFYASMARHLKVDVRELMDDRALVSILAQVYLSTPSGMDDLNA